MKTLIPAAIRCCLILLIPSVTYAISAQWDLDPISGDWNTADNWTPMGVPNGPADTATFGISNTTDVSISENTRVNGITFTSAATNPYTITASPGLTLRISGTGITNNSGMTQNFVTAADASGNIGTIVFSHNATAGSNVSISNKGLQVGITGGTTNFFDRSAANGSIVNEDGGTTNFFDRSTSTSNASISNEGGDTNFFDRSTATGSFLNEHGGFTGFFNNSTADAGFDIDRSSTLRFSNNSTAGNSGIVCHFSSRVEFLDNSTAGSAGILVVDESDLIFADNSTAASATIRAEFAGFITFEGSSRGGTAQIELFSFVDRPAVLSITHDLTIGSLEGNEMGFVGFGGNLTVGSNNLSTTFSGEIGGTGSLTKIGSGTLILSGAITTGDTNVNGGVLQMDGSSTSNTFVNHGGTLAGTGTVNGNLTNGNVGTVSPGAVGAPGMLTVTGNYTQAQYAALMIQLAGANAGEFSVLNILGTANLSGQLKPVLLNGFLPTVGESFTFLQYGAVNGTLFMFNRNIDNLPEHWEVSYFPTYAVLTVVAGNVSVPDRGSTFLLLALGLLGLVTYQRQLVRKQS